MDHQGQTPSSPSSNIVLLRPQVQTPPPPARQTGEEDVFPDVEDAAEEEEPRHASLPKLTLVPSIPEIRVDCEFHVVLGQAMKALSNDPFVFAKGEQLVRVAGEGAEARVVPMSSANIRERLSLQARWSRDDEPVHPPAAVASAIVRRGEWDHLRELRAMTTFPVLSSEGKLRTTEGYDPATRTFYVGGCTVRVPEEPTIEGARASCARLLDLIGDFPFVGEAHKSAWLAALLTPLSRFMHDGNTPLVVIQASAPGSGKSLLAQLIATIVTGSPVSVMACEKGEPSRKEILSKLRASPPLALIDNVVHRFGGANMATLLTSRAFEDRSLGHLKTLSAANDSCFLVTGNRILLAGDMARRCLHIRLQSNEERPHLRAGFRHPDLMLHAQQHRGELLSAALTILKAYAVTGMPDVGLATWGSFEPWSRIVRGALVWNGLLDPATTRDELEDEAEDTVCESARLVEGWHRLQVAMGRGETGMTVKEALAHLEREPAASPLLREALDGIRGARSVDDPLGVARRLREAKDRNFGGEMLRSVGNPKEALRWRVVSAGA